MQFGRKLNKEFIKFRAECALDSNKLNVAIALPVNKLNRRQRRTLKHVKGKTL